MDDLDDIGKLSFCDLWYGQMCWHSMDSCAPSICCQVMLLPLPVSQPLPSPSPPFHLPATSLITLLSTSLVWLPSCSIPSHTFLTDLKVLHPPLLPKVSNCHVLTFSDGFYRCPCVVLHPWCVCALSQPFCVVSGEVQLILAPSCASSTFR